MKGLSACHELQQSCCTVDNFNSFNPFEHALAVVRGASLGCPITQCGIGISAGVLSLTSLGKKDVFFLYVPVGCGTVLKDINDIPAP